jgi:predicted amidohydrolase YtcJ
VGKGDLVLRNANVLTVDPSKPRVEALAAREGRIVALGTWEDVQPYAESVRVLDLAGRTILPGFIDSHVHFTWTGLKETAVGFYEGRTVGEVQEILAQAGKGLPPGRLIFGMGLNHYLFPDHALPTSADLDAVAPENPVFLGGVTGHYAVANTLCLRELNLPADTPGLDASGMLRDRANTLGERAMRTRFADEQGLKRIHRAAADKAVSVGLTTVHALEGEDQPEDPTVRALLDLEADLPVRLVVWYQTTDVAAAQRFDLPRVGGCILLDGDFGPHTAAMLEPYVDQPDTRGTLYYTQEQVDTFVEQAHRAGLQIAMHAVGDRAQLQGLDAYQRALERWPRDDHRHRIEHFEIWNDEQVTRARELGVCLAIQPPFNAYFGGHERLYGILGPERALATEPVRSLIEAGVRVGGGSDSTVTPLGPLYGVHSAVNHSVPDERIDVERAIQLYTLDNAYLAFEETEKGSLEVGKLADLAVLEQDPTRVEREQIADIQVALTVVGGEIVYQSSLD